MSNLPKIHATCKAGCLWETVHRSEFEASASHIKQYIDESGICYLMIGKEYKIFASKNESNQFTCSIAFVYNVGETETTYTFTHTNEDKYAESVVFRLLDAIINTGATTITLVYELAGIRYAETISGTSLSLATENYLYVSGATSVLLYNSDATIVSEKGADGAKIVSTELIGQDADGGNIYRQTFDNGLTAEFTAPRGAQGIQGIQGIQGEKGDGAKPIFEKFTIPAGAWTELKNSQPFFYQTTITLTTPLTDTSRLSILRDDPVFYANFGICISNDTDGQNITLYATSVPPANANITMVIGG